MLLTTSERIHVYSVIALALVLGKLDRTMRSKFKYQIILVCLYRFNFYFKQYGKTLLLWLGQISKHTCTHMARMQVSSIHNCQGACLHGFSLRKSMPSLTQSLNHLSFTRKRQLPSYPFSIYTCRRTDPWVSCFLYAQYKHLRFNKSSYATNGGANHSV